MTEIILTFPVLRAAPLSCVWIRTGNPARPLACRWIVDQESRAGNVPIPLNDPERRRLCA